MTIIAEDCSHTQSLCAPPVSKKAFSKIGKAQDCYQIPSMGSGLPLHRKMKTAHAFGCISTHQCYICKPKGAFFHIPQCR